MPWIVLDPVMGDEGKLYVNEDVVPAYKSLLHMADVILPNQFEAEYATFNPQSHCFIAAFPGVSNIQGFRLLSGVKIDSIEALRAAITVLHARYHIPHIIVTSLSLPSAPKTLAVVGSTARSDGSPRLFRVDIPAIDCFFSGTGDMFAALTVVRFREAATAEKLCSTRAWVSGDEVDAVRLPLAKAAERVLASMHAVLVRTKEASDRRLARIDVAAVGGGECEKIMHLKRTKATEVQLVRNLQAMREPDVEFFAQAIEG
jgi:pyridoxine kinase